MLIKLSASARSGRALPWPPHVWMRTSIENCRFLALADALRRIPAAVRYLSCEPLLGPLKLDLAGIRWVIVGGESGPRAQPMRPAWVRGVRHQCLAHGAAFFFKQWGAHDEAGKRVGKARAGRRLDRRTWDEMPRSL